MLERVDVVLAIFLVVSVHAIPIRCIYPETVLGYWYSFLCNAKIRNSYCIHVYMHSKRIGRPKLFTCMMVVHYGVMARNTTHARNN